MKMTLAALAALIAAPAAAEYSQIQMAGHCFNSISEITDIYGDDLAPELTTKPNGTGSSFGMFEGSGGRVAVLLLPDARICVIWDQVADGDPA